MALTIADVERWNAGDVREVFHAASSRAQAAQDAADGIATLPAFTTWGGKAAQAAREAIAATGEQLKAHSAEVKSVANTARTAADEIERIQSELATLKSDAAALEMEIDPTTNQVVEGPGFKGTAMESLLKRQQLQPRVDKVLAEANFIDFALAGAINRADGASGSAATPGQQPPGPSKAVADAVQQPSTVGQAGKPGTWKDMLRPGGAAVPGTDAGDLAPTLQDQLTPPDARVPGSAANLDGFLFPPGTPLPGPPPSLMDRFNATRKAAGLPPLDPRADPEFMAQLATCLLNRVFPQTKSISASGR